MTPRTAAPDEPDGTAQRRGKDMVAELTFSWPADAPTYGQVRLRAFEERDVGMVMDLATDRYVPTIGSLPFLATHWDALDYIARQRGRLTEGKGFSFCVADRSDDTALGGIGLWLTSIEQGRTTGGYGVAPSARGRGAAGQALIALTAFAWTLTPVHRVELYIEPWNLASIRSAERAGFTRRVCCAVIRRSPDDAWTCCCMP